MDGPKDIPAQCERTSRFSIFLVGRRPGPERVSSYPALPSASAAFATHLGCRDRGRIALTKSSRELDVARKFAKGLGRHRLRIILFVSDRLVRSRNAEITGTVRARAGLRAMLAAVARMLSLASFCNDLQQGPATELGVVQNYSGVNCTPIGSSSPSDSLVMPITTSPEATAAWVTDRAEESG
jgi:hypothetical protein